jgi:hypothetical protein
MPKTAKLPDKSPSEFLCRAACLRVGDVTDHDGGRPHSKITQIEECELFGRPGLAITHANGSISKWHPDDFVEVSALAAGRTWPTIQVGTLAVAKRETGVCRQDEAAVCYEVYEMEGRPGYSFIFERGGYDSFSPDDVDTCLYIADEHCPEVTGYRFENVGRLQADYATGFFKSAFDVMAA